MEPLRKLLSNFAFPDPERLAEETTLSTEPSSGHLPLQQNETVSGPGKSTAPSPAKLLGPPLSPDGSLADRPPFKASLSDQTSLSMIRHGKRRSANRLKSARPSVGSITGDNPWQEDCMSRRSLPDLKVLQWLEQSLDVDALKLQVGLLRAANAQVTWKEIRKRGLDGLPEKSRRWTVPSKARPSQVVSGMVTSVLPKPRPLGLAKYALNPVIDAVDSETGDAAFYVKFGHTSPSVYSPDTPAMITLRRATQEPSPDRSFSPPNGRGNFSRTVSRSEGNILSPVSSHEEWQENVVPKEGKISRVRRPSAPEASPCKISFDLDGALPICDAAANTAFTEISVLPDLAKPNSASRYQRRTSIKITSGTSIHEIIWEDCDSLSDSSGTRTPWTNSSESTEDLGPRRHSVAVGRLQARLERSDESRKLSDSNAADVTAENETDTRNRPLGGLFGWRWGHQIRARASSIGSNRIPAENLEQPIHRLIITEDENLSSHADHVDFFPPLPSRKNSSSWRTPSPKFDAVENVENPASPTTQSLVCPIIPEGLPGQEFRPGRNPSAPADLPRLVPRKGSEVSKSSPNSSRHGRHGSIGSAIGISSHKRRKSADQGINVVKKGRRSSKRHQTSDGNAHEAVSRSKEPLRRHSDHVTVRDQEELVSDRRRSSVQEFIARYEAQSEAAKRWNALGAQRPSAAAGLVKLSRVNTLGGLKEERSAEYRSLLHSSYQDKVKDEQQGSEEPEEENSVSVDWID